MDKIKRTTLEEIVNKNYPQLAIWEEIKGQIRAKLVNTERNRDMLEKVPHKAFCDLSVIFVLNVEVEGGITAGISVTYSLMNFWEISVERLFEQAIQNMEKAGASFIKLDATTLGFYREEPVWTEETALMQEPEMYILTNREIWYGAALILSEHIRKEMLKKMKTEMYILPSSIHEVILLPKDESISEQELLSKVQEINKTAVKEEEFLADHVYLLGKDGTVNIVA